MDENLISSRIPTDVEVKEATTLSYLPREQVDKGLYKGNGNKADSLLGHLPAQRSSESQLKLAFSEIHCLKLLIATTCTGKWSLRPTDAVHGYSSLSLSPTPPCHPSKTTSPFQHFRSTADEVMETAVVDANVLVEDLANKAHRTDAAEAKPGDAKAEDV